MRAYFIQLNALDVTACDFTVEREARLDEKRETRIYSGKVITGSHDLLVNLHDIAKMEVVSLRAYDMREQFKKLESTPSQAGFTVKYASANSLVPDTLTFKDTKAIPKDIKLCLQWSNEEFYCAMEKKLGIITLQSSVATGHGINGVSYSGQFIYVKPEVIEKIKDELTTVIVKI